MKQPEYKSIALKCPGIEYWGFLVAVYPHPPIHKSNIIIPCIHGLYIRNTDYKILVSRVYVGYNYCIGVNGIKQTGEGLPDSPAGIGEGNFNVLPKTKTVCTKEKGGY